MRKLITVALLLIIGQVSASEQVTRVQHDSEHLDDTIDADMGANPQRLHGLPQGLQTERVSIKNLHPDQNPDKRGDDATVSSINQNLTRHEGRWI